MPEKIHRKYITWRIDPEIALQFNRAVIQLGAKPNLALEEMLIWWLEEKYPGLRKGKPWQ
jgi:hypothetical protein